MKMLGMILILIAFCLVISISGCTQQGGYAVAKGTVSYYNRPAPEYAQARFNETPYAAVYKISYRSRDAAIYGLLAVPKSCSESSKCGAFVLLPAATVSKESEQKWLANKLNSLGFATLAIDQRGIGETGGYVPDLKEDFQTWASGGETAQSKMVYDCLAAFDILASRPEVDGDRIFAAGSSMGGRFAILAAYIEPKIKALLLVSTSGYGLPQTPYQNMTEFLAYIDPDSYIGKLAGRKILMIHAAQDQVISLSSGQRTFGFAQEPKKFVAVDATFHGYYHLDGTPVPGIVDENIGWLTS